MHTCFPTSYPDELFYSICARYCDRLRRPWRRVLGNSFGPSTHKLRWDLPHGLSYFSQDLPPWYPLTRDQLVWDHTLYLFYLRVADSKQRSELANYVYSGSSLPHEGLFAWLSAHYSLEPFLRYCPSCVTRSEEHTSELQSH